MKSKISILPKFYQIIFCLFMINMSFLSCTKKAVISNEESEYTIAKRINTSETYEDFLDIFPNSKYKDEIISKVKEIKRKCSFAIEKNDYDIVCVDNNITCFKIYLLRYPEGLFKKDALSHIDSLCKKGYLYINTIDFNIHSNDGINFDFKSTPKIDLENLGINVKPNNTNNIFLNNYITTERNAYQTGARIYTIENSGEGKMTLTIKIDNNIILNKAFYEKIDAPDVMFRNNTDPGDSESATKVICERLYQKYHEALLDFFTTKCGYSVGLFSDLEKSDQPDLDVFLIDAGHQNTYRNKDFSNNIKNVLKNCILNNDIPYDIRINAYCILNNTVLYISNDKYNDDRKILEWISREKKENIYSTCIVGLSNHLDCIEYLKIKEWKPKDSFELNYHNAVHDKFKKCSSIILLQLCRTNYRYNGFQENIKEVLWDRFHRHDLNFAPTKTKAI